MTSVPRLSIAGADFAEHQEIRVAGAFRGVEDLLVEHDIQRNPRNVPYGIDAEAVDAHLDILAVGIGHILRNCGILGVEVNTVALDLTEFAAPVVPVKTLEVACMVIVIGIVYLF